MKNTAFAFLIGFSALLLSLEATAQQGTVLCNLLVKSHENPEGFDPVVQAHRHYFDAAMVNYMKNRIQWLNQKAKEHDASCHQHKPWSQQYHNCKANNPPGNLVVWLGSVLQAAGGRPWRNTQFGGPQIQWRQACQLIWSPSDCRNMQGTIVQVAYQTCPSWLG